MKNYFPTIRVTSSLIFVGFVLSSCGGSGSSNSFPKVFVEWPDQTKGIQAPTYAQSAQIQFVYGNGGMSQWSVDRPAGTGTQTIGYSGPTVIASGPAVLNVTFFSGTGGSGTQVATANVSVLVASDGTIQNSAGGNLGSVTYQSSLTGLAFGVANVAIGQSKTIVVNGANGGNIVALPQATVTLQVADNGQLGTLAGNSLTGVAEGTMHLTAKFGGFTQTLPIDITPRLSTFNRVVFPANHLVWDSVHSKIWGTFGPSTQYSNSIVDLDPATGAVGTPISVGSNPNSIAISSDGTTAWVGVDGANSVRKVDLTSRTAGASISLPTHFSGSMVANAIDINPTNNDEVAVCANETGSGGFEGPIVYRNGTMVGTEPQVYTSSHAIYTSGTTMIGIDEGTEPGSVYSINVTANSVDFAKTTQVPGAQGSGISLRGTQAVLGAKVFDISSTTQNGLLSFSNENLIYSTADLSSNLAFAAMSPMGPSVDTVRIRTFDLGNYSPTAAFDVPLGVSGQENIRQMIRYGSKGIAVLTDKATYLLAIAPGL